LVELIGATTTKTKVECALDPRTYLKGVKVSDAEMGSTAVIAADVLSESSTPRRHVMAAGRHLPEMLEPDHRPAKKARAA